MDQASCQTPGFDILYDNLWDTVKLRNDLQHYQEGFVMHPVPTFSEQSVREATLNAVSHRDYRHPGLVFVRQFPRRIEIVSPGGFSLNSGCCKTLLFPLPSPHVCVCG